MLCICCVQYGSHELLVAIEHLTCVEGLDDTNFKFCLIFIHLNLNVPSGYHIGQCIFVELKAEIEHVKRFQKEETYKARWSSESSHPCNWFTLIPTVPLSVFRRQGLRLHLCSPSHSQNHSINKTVIRKDFINILKCRRLSQLHKRLWVGKTKQKKKILWETVLLFWALPPWGYV